jgi:hypothetical protein
MANTPVRAVTATSDTTVCNNCLTYAGYTLPNTVHIHITHAASLLLRLRGCGRLLGLQRMQHQRASPIHTTSLYQRTHICAVAVRCAPWHSQGCTTFRTPSHSHRKHTRNTTSSTSHSQPYKNCLCVHAHNERSPQLQPPCWGSSLPPDSSSSPFLPLHSSPEAHDRVAPIDGDRLARDVGSCWAAQEGHHTYAAGASSRHTC